MRISRLHWVPGPLNKCSSFSQRTFALGPLQARADAFVLVVPGHRHHVRVAKNLVVGPYRGEMMNEPDHAAARKRRERPTASLTRNDQMTTRRDFQIRKSERFALQRHATVEFFNSRTLTNLNLFHALTVLLLS